MNRRLFFKKCLQATGLAMMGQLAWRGAVWAKDITMADPGKPPASSFNYVKEPKSAADRKGGSKKQGVAPKDQLCKDCKYYQSAQETSQDGQKVAPCLLFGNQYVYSTGWCNKWAKQS